MHGFAVLPPSRYVSQSQSEYAPYTFLEKIESEVPIPENGILSRFPTATIAPRGEDALGEASRMMIGL